MASIKCDYCLLGTEQTNSLCLLGTEQINGFTDPKLRKTQSDTATKFLRSTVCDNGTDTTSKDDPKFRVTFPKALYTSIKKKQHTDMDTNLKRSSVNFHTHRPRGTVSRR